MAPVVRLRGRPLLCRLTERQTMGTRRNRGVAEVVSETTTMQDFPFNRGEWPMVVPFAAARAQVVRRRMNADAIASQR